ncbi:MAG: PadR family transcriptional regulator [SAR202 cluster bacterium]|nr:PadR family transcriptional regulator [SAR202 cluster bacterium]
MRYPILALLSRQPGHGYEIKHALEHTFGAAWNPVNIGQVYVTLQRLERDRLVVRHRVEQDERPDKFVYRITGEGIEELKTWLREPAFLPRLSDDFYMKVLMAQSTGMEDGRALLSRQRTEFLKTLHALEDLLNGESMNGNRVARLLVDAAALRVQADLKWLDMCEEWIGERN